MELDDFKQAWQAWDARLDRQTGLTRQLFVERRTDRARSALRLLLIGQSLQALFGLGLAVAFGSFWNDHLHQTGLLVSGLLMHLYSIAMIVMAAPAILLLLTIDYSGPVVALQHRIALLRLNQRRSALWFGYAGCLMWVPLTVVLVEVIWGYDLSASTDFLAWNTAVAVAIASLLAGFLRWAKQPGRSRLADRIERSRDGWSLNRAAHAVDEIERFERDEA